MSGLIGLVDCNNFFVSCERAFDPRLENRPVGILSNNDGCVIARSNELKALGVSMGAPFHEIKDIIHEHKVQLRSSNFTLYGDFSDRVMNILGDNYPNVEAYSVDEAFVETDNTTESKAEHNGLAMSKKIQQWTRIPVSIGFSKTKTLAKVACRLVKKGLANNKHSAALISNHSIDEGLAQTPVGDLWGIGRKHRRRLEGHGIYTALDFKYARSSWIQKNLTINGLRMQRELHGEPCKELEVFHDAKKSIISSRSFGRKTSKLADLEESVAYHASEAAKKLRKQGSVAGFIGVSLKTNHYSAGPQYRNFAMTVFDESTDLTSRLIDASHQALYKIYQPGFEYHKAGVYLGNICAREAAQLSLFADHEQDAKQAQFQAIIDRVQGIFGARCLFNGAVGIKKAYMGKRENISPRYTTCWNELKEVK